MMRVREFAEFTHKVVDDFAAGVRDEGHHIIHLHAERWLMALNHEFAEQLWDWEEKELKGRRKGRGATGRK